MADYTYQELMRMQSDAIRRAQDMKNRARKAAGFDEGAGEREGPVVSAQEPRHIKMPEGYLANNDRNEKSQPSSDRRENVFSNIGNGIADINIDSDKALLLSLIMLLSEENADELLIMALIYMLS